MVRVARQRQQSEVIKSYVATLYSADIVIIIIYYVESERYISNTKPTD